MDVGALLAVLRRRWLVLVGCLIAGLLGATVVTRNTTKAYASTTKLFIDLPAARSVSEAVAGVQLTSQLLKSYSLVATSQTAVRQVATRLGAREAPHLSATPITDTSIIEIKAVQSSPQLARAVAGTASDVFVALLNDYESGKAEPVVPRVIDNPTLNTAPVRPRGKNNLVIGFLLGIVFGGGTAWLLESLDRSINRAAIAQTVVGAPVLGLVPRRRTGDTGSVLAEDPDDVFQEAFRSLRTAVRFVEMVAPLRSILVTSPSPGDGKTTVASQLALAMAEAGQRVILVDADLRRSRIAGMFSIQSEPGLSSVIIHDVPAADALVRVQSRLLILPSGPLPPNPSELLGSTGFTEVLDYLTANADVVIIDAPPVLPVTDAAVLSTHVDGGILVLRFGRTRRERAAEARRRLDVVGANIVGCVLNVMPAGSTYGAYEQYSYRAANYRKRKRRADTNPGASATVPEQRTEASEPEHA